MGWDVAIMTTAVHHVRVTRREKQKQFGQF